MKTLDIECPSCEEQLELDAGFAGGVCRCSNCGTLMTVPNDASQAESLMRPTSSASVGAGGLSSMGVPAPELLGERESSSTRGRKKSKGKGKGKKRKPGKDKQTKPKKEKQASPAIEPGEYRTSSGKVVRLDETTRVPMAESKRKQIRAATTVVFFAIVAAVVALAVVAILVIMDGPDGPGAAVEYDPAANPYALDYANVAGLPILERTAVVIEASEDSGAWMSQVADVIVAGLGRDAKSGKVALIGAGADEPVGFAGGSARSTPIAASKLSDWFGGLPAAGEADVQAAIKAALEDEPGTLILIVGEATDASDVEAWEQLVAAQEGLTVHTVFAGNNSPELSGWMNARGGEIVVLSASDIDALKQMAEDGAGGDE